MTAIIISASQNGWTGTTRKPIPVQPSAYGVTVLFQYAGRTRAILGADVFARVRGVSGIGARNPRRHAPIQSAATSTLRSVIPAVTLLSGRCVAGSFLPSWRGSRLFQFIPALKASGSLSIPLRFQPAKQSRGGFTNGLRSFACVLLHVRNQSMEFDAWRTEKLSLRNHNQGMSV